ncbi:hypothetical protein PV11_09519 [Exophiala sideris]|uniref:Uncharacterized protein n=1 Tax=Exophiala sideris TaxID=1016849 RepID=A0A0D1YS10_9EURO|nr:hypothetical protein PV11_09519 [Exophiala sideris]
MSGTQILTIIDGRCLFWSCPERWSMSTGFFRHDQHWENSTIVALLCLHESNMWPSSELHFLSSLITASKRHEWRKVTRRIESGKGATAKDWKCYFCCFFVSFLAVRETKSSP